MTENRLNRETSPYLLQHQDNPVHWWAWGPEALAEAKATNKPILLSVGYAACHWCHVMAHESFESAETAAVMNELFVNIKVDREERPDIDAIYMRALHSLGEQGGWPLTMFLDSQARPFWGGTYFPPTPRYGRPGFPDVLREVARIYREEPDKVAHNAGLLVNALKERQPSGAANINDEVLSDLTSRMVGAVDGVHVLGLGLSIVTKLAELHGGSVRAVSEGIGYGATFVLSLPLAPTSETTEDASMREAAGSSNDGETGPEPTLAGVRSALAIAGITWGREASAEEALAGEAMAEEVPLQDSVAGELAGARSAAGPTCAVCGSSWSTTSRTRASSSRSCSPMRAPGWTPSLRPKMPCGCCVPRAMMPWSATSACQARTATRCCAACVRWGPAKAAGHLLLALTAYAAPEDRLRALHAGFGMHLAKPVDPAELLASIARLVSRS